VLGCIALYFTCLLSHFSEVIKTVHLVQRMMIGVGELFATSPLSECTSCYQKGRVGSKALLQQNPAVLT